MQTLREPIKRPTWGSRVRHARAMVSSWLSLGYANVTEEFLLARPVTSITLSAGVWAALVVFGLQETDVRYGTQENLLYSDTDTIKNSIVVHQLFPTSPRISSLLFTCVSDGSISNGNVSSSSSSADGNSNNNALTMTAFDEIWDIARKVAVLEVGIANDTYETLCYRHHAAEECAPYGVLSVWGNDESLYRTTVGDDESLRMDLSATTYFDGSPIQRDMIFGDYTIVMDQSSGEQIIANARAVVVAYALEENETNVEKLMEWEDAFLEVVAGVDLTACEMFRQAGLSNEAEKKAPVGGWPIAAAISLVAMASSLLLGDFPRPGVPPTHTRISLGLVGVGAQLLASAAAIGTLSMGGVPLSGISMWLIPVVCVSLGLKNMFGMCAELDDALCDVPAWHRVRGAARQWMSGSAFVVGVSCILPGIAGGFASAPAMRWCCWHLAAGVFAGWLTQIFTFVPALYLDESRRDSGRFDVACCLVASISSQELIPDEAPRIRSRRDSFVVESLSGQRESSPFRDGGQVKSEGSIISALWDEDGDNRRTKRTDKAKALSVREEPSKAGSPVATRPTLSSPPSSSGRDTASPTTNASPPISPQSNESQALRGRRSPGSVQRGAKTRGHKGWVKSSLARIFGRSSQPGDSRRSPNIPFDLNSEMAGADFRNRRSGRIKRQNEALVRRDGVGRPWKGAADVGRIGQGSARRTGKRALGGNVGECCLGASALVQRFCNWLVDDSDWAKWGLLAGFGALLVGSTAVCVTHASPGYNPTFFYMRSSYLAHYVAEARNLGVLLGESSVPAAAYVTGLDLSLTVNQRAILDLETALVGSSEWTVNITTTTTSGDLITSGGDTVTSHSSWLRGFLSWAASSDYSSSLTSSDADIDSNGETVERLWAGTAELFDTALDEFLRVPGNRRFNGDLSFTDGRAVACRVWVRHTDFVGANAVAIMKAAKNAAASVGLNPNPFVYAREYAYAEHYESVTWDLLGVILASAIVATSIGYAFFYRHAMVGILVVATVAVEVDALALILLAGDGLNVYSITPSLLVVSALGAAWTGSLLTSFKRQDPERSFEVNVRVSVAETVGPLCSAAAAISVGTLPLLFAATGDHDASYGSKFVRHTAATVLWAAIVSLLHGILFAPALLLVFGETASVGERTSPPIFVIEDETLGYLPYALREYDVELRGDGFAMVIGGQGRAALVLSDEEDQLYGDADNSDDNTDDQIIANPDGRRKMEQSARRQNRQDKRSNGEVRERRRRTRGRAGHSPRALSPSNVAWDALGAREAVAAAFNRDDAVLEAGTETLEEGRGDGAEVEPISEEGAQFSKTMGVRAWAMLSKQAFRPRSNSWGEE